MRARAFSLAAGLTVLAALVLPLTFSGCANGWFYQPDRVPRAELEQQQLDQHVPHEVVTLRAADGSQLNGWFLKTRGPAKATIVFLHGNAGNLTVHVPFVAWLPVAGYNVLVIDYRGYGLSEGSPSRRHVLEDARTAYDYARTRPEVDPSKLILLGQSLGGANAIALAGGTRLPGLRAVIVDSAFSSYRRIAGEHATDFPYGVRLVLYSLRKRLVTDELSPIDVVSRIAPVPLLLIAGDADGVVPQSHAALLFAQAGDPKLLWRVHGAGHIEALSRFRALLAPPLLQFMERAVSGSSVASGSVDW
jgi:fermentation-respiration switch protein FrsA (DUF1100 family)